MPTQIPNNGFLLMMANSFNVSLSPLILSKDAMQFLKDPCPGKIILSELDMVLNQM